MMLEARYNKRLNFFKCYFVCLLWFDICRFFFFFAFPCPPKTNKYFQKRLYARSCLNNYNSLCPLCYLEYTTCTKNFVTTWNCTWRNLEIACNKLSSTKYMCPDRFSEKTPCCSILVRATTSRKWPLPVSDH